MYRPYFNIILIILLLGACSHQQITKPPPLTEHIEVSPSEADEIGRKIWLNESGGQMEHLIAWNVGEQFASLGIGHFIWYPPGQEGPFQETFPQLIQLLKQQGVVLPTWLNPQTDCPWNTRSAFLNAYQSDKMHSLRQLLAQTFSQQTQFLIQRLQQALPKIMTHLDNDAQKAHVRQQFYRVAQTPQGIYALIDYLNFKGEGIALSERYQGQGWGLLQVLTRMPSDSAQPLAEFAAAAEWVLIQRVNNAPPQRGEARWLSGWLKRVQSYRG